jgi:hypothetical protein
MKTAFDQTPPKKVEAKLIWLLELYTFPKLIDELAYMGELIFGEPEFKKPYKEQVEETAAYQYWACIELLYIYENLILLKA